MTVDMIQKGDRFITRAGRVTKPHPAIGKCPHRMLKAHRGWLKEEYIEEARYNMCGFNETLANALDLKNWTVADQECALQYVFGSVKTLMRYPN